MKEDGTRFYAEHLSNIPIPKSYIHIVGPDNSYEIYYNYSPSGVVKGLTCNQIHASNSEMVYFKIGDYIFETE